MNEKEQEMLSRLVGLVADLLGTSFPQDKVRRMARWEEIRRLAGAGKAEARESDG